VRRAEAPRDQCGRVEGARWKRQSSAPGIYSPKALKYKERRDWETDSAVGDFGKEIRHQREEEGDPDMRARSVSSGRRTRRALGQWLGSTQSGKWGENEDGPRGEAGPWKKIRPGGGKGR
jgi:hypothetical protein